ncbi:hypothetical protein B0I73DRAFT_163242 [Yarrowia lipolytica]|jgi:hypothetical protein|nr:hypothetical protein BKA91DRAFT_161311 [Yarrowia lipolytica]KAE8168879.1 hypothetical protein BKA90DRAFT_156460 [Yarrowia lipolytica]KAJ8053328.1 hypothetical protein LXG23DRAFT_37489 [Yarrowia lipolytica]RDW37092.1 hypothetical protein B0I73DRAFT_163242 [Yarrowia lipolytica]RMI95390.1 hypothetical protein BD777DRAFT_163124 [Yarrowia lipolytica]
MEPTNRYNYLTSFWIAPELIRRPDETKDVAETPVVNPWLDVSLGTGSGSRSSQGSLASDIARIKPQEIVREKQMKELELDNGEFYPELVGLRSASLSYSQPAISTTDSGFQKLTLTTLLPKSMVMLLLAIALEYSKLHFPLGLSLLSPGPQCRAVDRRYYQELTREVSRLWSFSSSRP